MDELNGAPVGVTEVRVAAAAGVGDAVVATAGACMTTDD